MKKVLLILVFLLSFICLTFIAHGRSDAATFSPTIGTLKTGEKKPVTVSGLDANKLYYWREGKSTGALAWDGCFSADASGTIADKEIGPLYEAGDYILTLSLLADGVCRRVIPAATDPLERFKVEQAPATSNPLDPNTKCSDQGITNPDPPFFIASGKGNYILTFKVTLDNVTNFLKDKEVRMHADLLGGNGTTQPVQVTGSTFSLAIEDEQMKNATRQHTSSLEFKDPATGSFTQLCKDVKYTVAPAAQPPDFYACVIDMRNVPNGEAFPNSTLNFQFSGAADTEYQLVITVCNPLCGPQLTRSTTTDSKRRGLFLDVPLNGKHGDTLNFHVARTPQNSPICSAAIKLNTNASIPGPLPSDPPPVASASAATAPIASQGDPFKPKTCTPNGGTPNGGIQTAIGCVPTHSPELVGFIMRTLLGLSGGIALLLIIFSGYRMMTAVGNPEAIQGARETLTSAIVGLVFIILSVVILEIIGVTILAIPGFGI